MKLAEAKAGYHGTVQSVCGNHHLISRLIGVGIVEGSEIQVIQNIQNQPVLFYCRDSIIALSKRDCRNIEISGGVEA